VRSGQRFIKIYDEFKGESSLKNIDPSKLIVLLKIKDKETRKEFLKINNIKKMSVREIDECIGGFIMEKRVKFDKEYSTQYKKEVEYLETLGIKYTFVKNINNISTYKYKKTSELFNALGSFYVEN
jgi:hypothetical protein